MLVKMYGDDQNKEERYSPSSFIASEKQPITSKTDPKNIFTS
jgi:hypothetical protein